MRALRIFVYSFTVVICLAGIAVGVICWLETPSKQSLKYTEAYNYKPSEQIYEDIQNTAAQAANNLNAVNGTIFKIGDTLICLISASMLILCSITLLKSLLQLFKAITEAVYEHTLKKLEKQSVQNDELLRLREAVARGLFDDKL